MGRNSIPISVVPTVPAYVKARTEQLGLKRGPYLAILLHNHLHGPAIALPTVPEPRRLKYVRMQVSLPAALRRAGKRAAKRAQLSFSRLLQGLIAHDAEAVTEVLAIHPVRGKRKPALR